MKVFGFLSQKTIKVQFSKFRKISMDFYFVPNNQYGGGEKKSTSEAQKRSLYVKMFYFQQRLKNK